MAPSESSARLALEREAEGPSVALGGSSGIGEEAAAVVAVEVDDESGSVLGAAAAAAAASSSACRGGREKETADAEVALLR